MPWSVRGSLDAPQSSRPRRGGWGLCVISWTRRRGTSGIAGRTQRVKFPNSRALSVFRERLPLGPEGILNPEFSSHDNSV